MRNFAIDIHSHVEFAGSMEILKKRYGEEEIFSRFIMPAMGAHSAQINRGLMPGLREPLRDPQKKIQDMETRGIGLSVLSATPFAFFYEVEEELAIELARFQNNQLSEIIKDHPNHFSGMATLPMQNPKAALQELERSIRKLDLRGVEIGSHAGKRELGDEAFWPLYEALEELAVPMAIHPHNVAGIDRLQDFYLSNLIGNPLDTTIAAAHLIFSGVLERYPNLKILLAHGGGQLPYILGRIEHGYHVRPECRGKIHKSPREFLGNFYFDTITHSPEALSYLISIAGSDHVLLGSDYPYDMGDPDPTQTISQQRGLSDQDRRKIICDNAMTLFGLQAS